MSGVGWGPVLVGLSLPLVTLVGVLFARRQNNASANKSDAEAAKIVKDAALELLEPYRQEVRELKEKVDHLENGLAEANAHSAQQDRNLKETREQLGQLRTGIRLHVLPIIAWLDSGAAPPPPVISEELRRLLGSD